MTGRRLVRIIDNDPDLLETLGLSLRVGGFTPELFSDGASALAGLGLDYAGVVLSDVRMPGMDGLELLARVRRLDPDLPVILMTGHGDIEMAVSSMRNGAWDFITKPVGLELLVAALRRASQSRALVMENRDLRNAAARLDADELLLGESSAALSLRQSVTRIGEAGVDVLIDGPSGVGKEYVARAIHRAGPRRARSFMHVACDVLDESRFALEFMGAEAGHGGAARQARLPGRLETAHRGTLYLDRIDLLPLSLQGQFLRLIETREYWSLGAISSRPLDVHVLASSGADLERMVAAGTFREDLYYRLSSARLAVPALDERREDILPIFRLFLRQASAGLGLAVPEMTAATLARLNTHDWPGNLRELQRFAQSRLLGAGILPHTDALDELPGLAEMMMDYEARIITETLSATRGNATQAMKQLNISRKTFYDKVLKHKLVVRKFRK
ncbi:sigma-54-dependent Fis family transcriptional regulator (plasmid) [Rhizobium sp. NIBRBAC000502774]|nr:sigma-54-dependent Fis family transcriptional regulator [Rhizobium sp. NIBRBAC000502774]